MIACKYKTVKGELDGLVRSLTDLKLYIPEACPHHHTTLYRSPPCYHHLPPHVTQPITQMTGENCHSWHYYYKILSEYVYALTRIRPLHTTFLWWQNESSERCAHTELLENTQTRAFGLVKVEQYFLQVQYKSVVRAPSNKGSPHTKYRHVMDGLSPLCKNWLINSSSPRSKTALLIPCSSMRQQMCWGDS